MVLARVLPEGQGLLAQGWPPPRCWLTCAVTSSGARALAGPAWNPGLATPELRGPGEATQPPCAAPESSAVKVAIRIALRLP